MVTIGYLLVAFMPEFLCLGELDRSTLGPGKDSQGIVLVQGKSALTNERLRFQEGDILRSWALGLGQVRVDGSPACGVFETSFDWLSFEEEVLPLFENVLVSVTRNGQNHLWTVSESDFLMMGSPHLNRMSLMLEDEIRRTTWGPQIKELLEVSSCQSSPTGTRAASAACYFEHGILEARRRSFSGARRLFHQALRHAEDPKETIFIWRSLADSYTSQNRYEEAEECLRIALSHQKDGEVSALLRADLLTRLGFILHRLHSPEASVTLAQAKRIVLEQAPEGQHARSLLSAVGAVHFERSEWASSIESFLEAVRISELAGLREGARINLKNARNAARSAGDLVLADQLEQRLVSLSDPGSVRLSNAQSTYPLLTTLALSRGLDEEIRQGSLRLGDGVVVGFGEDEIVAPFRYGDLILGWRTARHSSSLPDVGAFETVADWFWFSKEIAPRSGILFDVQRGDQIQTVEVSSYSTPRVVLPNLILRNESLFNSLEFRKLSGLDGTQLDLLRQDGLLEEYAALAQEVASQGRSYLARWMLAEALSFYEGTGEDPLAQSLVRHGISACGEHKEKVWFLDLVARSQRQRGERDSFEATVRRAIREAEKLQGPNRLMRAEFLLRLGSTWMGCEPARSYRSFEKAWELSRAAAPGSSAEGRALNSLGAAAWHLGRFERASEHFDAAVELHEGIADERALRLDLGNLAGAAERHGDVETLEAARRREVEVRTRSTPMALETARAIESLSGALERLGRIAEAQESRMEALNLRYLHELRDLDTARALYMVATRGQGQRPGDREARLRRALDIVRSLEPDSLDDAALRIFWRGRIQRELGDLAEASASLQEALSLSLRIRFEDSPARGRELEALVREALCVTERYRGSLYSARQVCSAAVSRRDFAGSHSGSTAPGASALAAALVNLASVYRAQGELELALRTHQRALGLWPRDANRGASLTAAGIISRELGQLDEAEQYFHEALELLKQLGADSALLQGPLNELGETSELRQDLETAKLYYETGLELVVDADPVRSAQSMRLIGLLSGRIGDFEEGILHIRRAVEIEREWLPDSFRLAESLQHLGRAYAKVGRLKLAAECLREMVAILDRNQELAGRSPSLFESQERDLPLYRDAIEILALAGDTERALVVLEQSKARHFRSFLGPEVRWTTEAGLPIELEKARLRMLESHDEKLSELMSLGYRATGERAARLRAELEGLKLRQGRIITELRNVSPSARLFSEDLIESVEELSSWLDPGTAIVYYSVNSESTTVFGVNAEGRLTTQVISVDGKDLANFVQGYLRLIYRGSVRVGGDDDLFRETLERTSSRLYRMFLGPVEDVFRDSTRLLIVPDRELLLLPFASLIQQERSGDRRPRYLIDLVPVHVAASLSVHRHLRGDRKSTTCTLGCGSKPRIIAFGDPVFDSRSGFLGQTADRDPVVRLVTQRGLFNWKRLPATRLEVDAISSLLSTLSLFEGYLGEDAMEEQAKVRSRHADILHFATHGYLEEGSPLDSGLILSIPDRESSWRENGILQVWEIIAELELKADLVVLSACASALGDYRDGEGLLGLTQAFQLAGARSVVGTLWEVSDRATADFMVHFYGALLDGVSKDQAIRVAQLALINGLADSDDPREDLSAPYYWAPFQLYGDWM